MVKKIKMLAVLAALAVALTASPAWASSSYVFTSFDGTGDASLGTTVDGINNNGDIVGFSMGANGNMNWIRKANGTFTLLDLGFTTFANGVNKSQLVVGQDGNNAFQLQERPRNHAAFLQREYDVRDRLWRQR